MSGRNLVLGACALAAGYLAIIRPLLVRWGATEDDCARALPGDELIEQPHTVTNRAISINAPVADVWPWIAQMGDLPRGGYYSYELVERLMGMKVENATRLLAEYQHPRVGEQLDRKGTMTVRAVVEGEALVLGPPPGLWLDTTWALAVYPEGATKSRFISRVRVRINRWSPGAILMLLLLDPGQLIMERKMLLEVKRRAEVVGDTGLEPVTFCV